MIPLWWLLEWIFDQVKFCLSGYRTVALKGIEYFTCFEEKQEERGPLWWLLEWMFSWIKFNLFAYQFVAHKASEYFEYHGMEWPIENHINIFTGWSSFSGLLDGGTFPIPRRAYFIYGVLRSILETKNISLYFPHDHKLFQLYFYVQLPSWYSSLVPLGCG